MPAPTTVPPDRPEGVRTAPPPSLVGSRCLVCQEDGPSRSADCLLRTVPSEALA